MSCSCKQSSIDNGIVLILLPRYPPQDQASCHRQGNMPELLCLFRCPGITGGQKEIVLKKCVSVLGEGVVSSVETELCFYVEVQGPGMDVFFNVEQEIV
jgi:hypothetical protein